MSEKQEQTKQQVVPTTGVQKRRRWIDASTLIAVVALLISTVSAFISLREMQLMSEQQSLLATQKEATVWPYLDVSTYIIYDTEEDAAGYNDSKMAEYRYMIKNKGVGPAILSDVQYIYNGEAIKGWELPASLVEMFKDSIPSMSFSAQGNIVIDDYVLAPGELVQVVAVDVSHDDDSLDFNWFMNTIPYYVEFCYCSVYGDCWKVVKGKEVTKDGACELREGVR